MWLAHQVNGSNNEFYNIGFPFVAQHTSASVPALVRPLRQSFSIRNISASQEVSGVIRVLSTNNPMYWAFEYASYPEFAPVRIHKDEHENLRKIVGSAPPYSDDYEHRTSQLDIDSDYPCHDVRVQRISRLT